MIDAGRQLALSGGMLAAAALALMPVAGLGWRGFASALSAYAVVAALVLAGLPSHAPHRRFGPANAVTLARAAYTALLLGLLGEGLSLGTAGRWTLVAAGLMALALDGVDGRVARRSGFASAFGARFDMEVDALFVLALSALVYRAGQAGAWVLASGLMRYAFVLAGWLWPPLAAPLRPSFRRKLICVLQILALLGALAPAVGPAAARLFCLGGLTLLLYSFGADCIVLAAAGRAQPRAAPGRRNAYVSGRSDSVLNRQVASPPAMADQRALRQIDRAITDLRRGGFVVLRRGDTALLAQAAEAVNPESLQRLKDLAGEKLSLVLTRRRAAALGLVEPPRAPGGAALLRVAADADAAALRDLADPGAAAARHLPLEPGAAASDIAEAVVELVKLARLLPAAVTGHLAARAAAALAEREGLLLLEAADVAAYQATAARSLRPVSEARVPLRDAEDTRIIAFRPTDGGIEHLAILIGDPDGAAPVLVRLHSECFTGDLLGSLRCDCGDQLRGAIAEIARAGSGVLLYLAQEGRGIGLVNKLRAYQLQDAGLDTVDANEELGFDADERVYLPAAEMLRHLGFARVRLLTNNPEKVAALTRCGIDVVERVPHIFPANGHNERYLRTKATRSGHIL